MQFRDFDERGEATGGPMYYIEKSLGKSETAGDPVCDLRRHRLPRRR
ncbi:MAG: hypothetical protein R3C68_17140 [Myxococcota bacterium]